MLNNALFLKDKHGQEMEIHKSPHLTEVGNFEISPCRSNMRDNLENSQKKDSSLTFRSSYFFLDVHLHLLYFNMKPGVFIYSLHTKLILRINILYHTCLLKVMLVSKGRWSLSTATYCTMVDVL